jgi:UDP-2,3-diacylglucosamine pyrophosphatase LpxH
MNKIIFFITAYRNFLIKKKKIQKTFKTSKINKYKLIAAYDKF